MSSDASWSNNNMAHVATWGNLKDLKQHSKAFPAAKGLTMSQLAFYNPVASLAQRKVAAKPVVVAFMALTSKGYESEYEQGYTYSRVFDKLVDSMADGKVTMPGLGQVVDSCYRFSTEV